MATVQTAEWQQGEKDTTETTNYTCNCCGRIGFVYIEEIGEYLCREAYKKYAVEREQRALRIMKGKTDGRRVSGIE